MIDLICKQCGIGFSVHPYRESSAIYCSYKCYWQAKKGCIPWNKGKSNVYSKETLEVMSKVKIGKKRGPHSELHKKRIGLANKGRIPWSKGKKKSPEAIAKTSGENHYNWKGGISKEPYPMEWTNILKENIRYRNNYQCQKCGVPQLECNQKLCIHHIDGNKKNIYEQNLISLCRKCHIQIHQKRQMFWENYFNLKNRRRNEEVANSMQFGTTMC